MKTVYLILYLYHSHWGGSASTGGPSITVAPMPSLAACEAVGTQAKSLADSRIPDVGGNIWRSIPAVYRCIEVASK